MNTQMNTEVFETTPAPVLAPIAAKRGPGRPKIRWPHCGQLARGD